MFYLKTFTGCKKKSIFVKVCNKIYNDLSHSWDLVPFVSPVKIVILLP